MNFGYARVSTDGQSVDAQVKALRAAGAEKIFRETTRGPKTDRAQLRRAIASLGESDALLMTRVDRLARSTRDLIRARTGKGREHAKAARRSHAPCPHRPSARGGACSAKETATQTDLPRRFNLNRSTISRLMV